MSRMSNKYETTSDTPSHDTLILRNIMRTPEGRKFVWHMLWECGYFNSTHTDNPATSAYNAGRRDVAVNLLAKLDAAIEGDRGAALARLIDTGIQDNKQGDQ